MLFPPGITDLRELPAYAFDAITYTMTFLSFRELPRDEQPDRSIWLDSKALKEHFDAVERRRKEGMSPETTIEEPVSNEAAKGLIVG